MAKPTLKRRAALDTPEGLMDYAELAWERVKPYALWLVLVLVVIAIGLGAWVISAHMRASRNEKAAAALARVTPKIDLKIPAVTAATDLEKFIKQYPGTPAAREAQLLRANILYKLQQYSQAAQAYQSLSNSSDPAWNNLIIESLSYCYEGMGQYKKAAEVLHPVVSKASGPMKTQLLQRLAMLYDQAQEPKQAAVYWRQLLENPPDTTMRAYIQGKLAADEAAAKK
jgi:predicted negative regulator of RcsB-dependent stress response